MTCIRRTILPRRFLVIAAALWLLLPPRLTQGTSNQPESPSASTSVKTIDPSDWLLGVRQRGDELAGRAEDHSDPMEGARLWQAAANVALAHELVPMCAQWLLGPHAGIAPGQVSAARESLQRADAWLAKARGALESATTGAGVNGDHAREKEQAQMIAQARLVQSTLEAFASGLRALWLPGEGDEEQDVRKAASELTILLESDDPRVVSAASLWYAALRSREPELSPSLSVLGFVLSRPPVAAERTGLMSKLLHCRLIARRDGFAAALTLLAQLEEQSRDWFADPETRKAALAAITAVEIDVLRDWANSLPTEERGWCEKRLAELLEERTIESSGLLEFLEVVPLLREQARRP